MPKSTATKCLFEANDTKLPRSRLRDQEVLALDCLVSRDRFLTHGDHRGVISRVTFAATAGHVATCERGKESVSTNTVMMDERLSAVRQEIEAGSVSPHSLVLLFSAASDAEHAGDIATLEQTLDLARAIAEMAEESLQAETERLATICEQSLSAVRERREASGATEPRDGMIICPECGNQVPADALRCRRCGHLFI